MSTSSQLWDWEPGRYPELRTDLLDKLGMLLIKLFQRSNIFGVYNSFHIFKHGSKTIQPERILFLALSIARYGYFILFFVFYRHADCCQFVAFIRNPEESWGMATALQSSIIIQSSCVLEEISKGSIVVSEKRIYICSASSPFIRGR